MKSIAVEYDDLKRFTRECLSNIGVCVESAEAVMNGLCETSLFGIDSHGIKLLPHYVRAAASGRINGHPNFKFEMKFPCAGYLDADHGFGHHAGSVAMERCIELAANFGIGAISVGNSSHFGAAGFFALQAARKDMIGLAFTHADSLMLSSGGSKPYFGTNPISFCAPVLHEDPFYLDMATTTVSWNKILSHLAEGENLDHGWAVDGEGKETVDPKMARALFPIGDYKGFGLAMMVEILCSLLTAMPYGKNITSMYKAPIGLPRLLGHFFVAINIEAFTEKDLFKKRLQDMMNEVRREPSLTAHVMCPGDPQKKFCEERTRNGIPVSEATWSEFKAIATQQGINLPKQV
jgi:LDH2 family malate/lactate/ureidoglycolate dehydrogenase